MAVNRTPQETMKSRRPCSGQAGLPGHLRLRRLRQGDCVDQLTGMLHRAFSRLGEIGVPCSCVNQAPEVTRWRIARGDCFVAVSGERVVGTLTLCGPDATSDCRHYRDARAASVRQLGVDPHFQGKGIGTALLYLAEHRARRLGYGRLVLDTPEAAHHLIDYYHRQGFQVVETLQFSGRPYRSVVFAKSLAHHVASDRRPSCRRQRMTRSVPARPRRGRSNCRACVILHGVHGRRPRPPMRAAIAPRKRQ